MFELCLNMGGWNEESETADKQAQKTQGHPFLKLIHCTILCPFLEGLNHLY